MINVACLDPQYFAAILDGRKQTEWRDRMRPDPILERVQAGERIVLQERRTDRAIFATVRHVRRFRRQGGYRYGIRLLAPRLGSTSGVRHLQGWQRRENL